MNTAEIHTLEHLGATYLRNDPAWKNQILYFGPMGCRTGFYLLVAGDLTSKEIMPLILRMYEFIRDYTGDIPGADARECGNWLDQNLPMAQYQASRYLEVLTHATEENLTYPQ